MQILVKLSFQFVLIWTIVQILVRERSSAYPEFIGYSYTSCLTCHFNGQGNGPLNDYGRALWSAEIAGRALAFGRTDEQLAEASGFLGSRELPWWVRPGLKGRNIWIKDNPGGAGQVRQILMQNEVNSAFFFDRDQRYALVFSFGYVPVPASLANSPRAKEIPTYISREHYLRYQATDSLWLYLGMQDKVFGIRTVNHTAFSRGLLGFGQNDQTHGVVGHWIKEGWELTGHLFAGNLFQESSLRQAGISSMFEYDLKENWRVGASVLVSSNQFIGNQRFSVHSKVGYGNGSSVLTELGQFSNPLQVQSLSAETSGTYFFSSFLQRVVRGYHMFFSGQYLNLASKRSGDLTQFSEFRPGIGFLIFPFARLELRLELEHRFPILADPNEALSEDRWLGMFQVHWSL